MRILALLLLASLAAADTLDDALARAGFARADLGWRPQAWWDRWPRAVDHGLDHFDPLFAEPLATVPFTRVLGHAVRDELSAEGLAAGPVRGAHALYRLVHKLGINRRHGGIRPYTPNLLAKATPLDAAILELYRRAGRQTRFVTFQTESPYPRLERDLKAAAAKLPEDVGGIVGKLVLDVLDAHRWAERAFRNVKAEDRAEVCRRFDLAMESVDALEYVPACDDVAKAWDEASLWYAAGKCVEALDTARRRLAALEPRETEGFDWETPLGWIRVRGPGSQRTDCTDALLIVDLGGDDVYVGPAGATTATRPIGLLLDLGGDDVYSGGRAAQGCGRCGVGVVLDAAGADRYEADALGQGAGQFGFGALLDLAGTDRYVARYSAQGCGLFGVGLLLDAGGDDEYRLHADGQGFGGVGGVGVLADRAGHDVYHAEPDPKISGRASYHSEGKVSVSNAQGCAMGRRGDGADGHNWAGGLGALLDAEGDDRYAGGNWTLGTGYWFGTGVVWDGGGDDAYSGHVWSQATGAHFCIGVLVDEGGDDRHLGKERSSLSFGHDFAITVLLNAGGDDRYEVRKGDGLGFSINRSVSLLIDTAGADTYRGRQPPGFARYDERFENRRSYWGLTDSLGLFLDLGGEDAYAHAKTRAWGDAEGTPNWSVRNVGLGLDLDSGAVDWTPRRR